MPAGFPRRQLLWFGCNADHYFLDSPVKRHNKKECEKSAMESQPITSTLWPGFLAIQAAHPFENTFLNLGFTMSSFLQVTKKRIQQIRTPPCSCYELIRIAPHSGRESPLRWARPRKIRQCGKCINGRVKIVENKVSEADHRSFEFPVRIARTIDDPRHFA
jgi:hypothetical protein